MNIQVIGNRIIFKRVDIQGKTKSGIILGTHTAQADQRDTGYGQVLAVGPESTLVEGDIIAFNDRQPLNVVYLGETYQLIRESDLFFIVRDDVEVIDYKPEGAEFVGMAEPQFLDSNWKERYAKSVVSANKK